MNSKTVWMLILFTLASVHPADAQQPGRVYRVTLLATGSAATNKSRTEAFLHGLRDLGYAEGKNIVIDYRYAEGKRERWPEIATEVVQLKPDVIVVGGNGFTAAVKQATSTIPIVVTSAGDLVGGGLIASLGAAKGNCA